jgi:hypothetical protein
LGRLGVVAVLTALATCAHAANDTAGDWEGNYVCAQGPTALTLRISPEPANQVIALFHFHARPDNPLVPEGCFEMAGAYQPETGQIDLSAGRWILEPPGFVTVDLSGTVSRDGSQMTGSVLGPGCTVFSLHRVVAVSRQIPKACLANNVVANAK